MKLKKTIATLLAVVAATGVGGMAVACSESNTDNKPPISTTDEFTVTFDSDGGSAVESQTVDSGDKAAKPADPAKDGYDFDGWYTVAGTQWDFDSDTVTANVTLKAHWTEQEVPPTDFTLLDFTEVQGGLSVKAKLGATLPEKVVLPSSKDNKAVVEIAANGFENATIASVKIPSSVKNIGAQAFRNAKGLATVTGAENVEKIDSNAFFGTAWVGNLGAGLNYLGKTLIGYGGTIPANTTVEVKAGTLGIAAGALQNQKNVTSLTLPAGLKNIGSYAFGGTTDGAGIAALVIPDSVTEIADNAFRNAKSLATLTVGKGVTSIGANAFGGTAVTSLTYNANATVNANAFGEVTADSTIVFGDDVTALPVNVAGKFTNLTAVTLGEGITAIPDNAFDGKAKLATVTVKGTLTSIGALSFRGTAIAEFTVNKEVTAIGGGAFASCANLATVNYNATNATGTTSAALAFAGCSKLKTVVVGGDVTSIPDYLFKDCAALDTLTIGANVTSIGQQAFYGTALKTVTIPAKVATIGANAFGNCASLATVEYNATNATYGGNTTIFANASTVTVGGGVTNIPAYFVKGNTAIASITLPSGVSVGDYAFQNCTALATIEGYDSVGAVGAQAFEGSKYYEDNTQDGIIVQGSVITGYRGEMPASFTLNAETIPAGKTVTSIAANAFKNQTKLVGVSLPATVVSIGANAFDGCTALVGTVDLSNVTSVGESAFNGCNGITEITLGEGLTSIGANAFKNCSKAAMEFKANSLTALGASAFSGCAKLTAIEINGVAEIPETCFSGCNALASVKLGDTVETVGNNWAPLASVTTFTAPSLKHVGNYGLRNLKVTTYSVENIVTFGNGALAGYANPNVVIGENCTAIGLHLFNYQSVDNNQNPVYTPTSTLNSLTINSTSLTKIPERMAAGCGSLTTLTLASNINEIGDYAFSGTGITSFNVANITKFGDYAFDGCSNLTANNLTLNAIVGTGAFKGCGKLTGKLTIGGTHVTIGDNAFNGAKFTEVEIGTGVKSIGKVAFRGNAISKLTILEGITDIGDMAFEEITCKYVELPASLTSLGNSVFAGAGATSKVKVVKLNGSGTSLGTTMSSHAFVVPDANLNAYKQNYDSYTFYAASEVTENLLVVKNGALTADLMQANEVEIPANVTSIAKGALDNAATVTVVSGNTALKAVDNVVYSIDGATLVCFPKANNVQEYDIPNTVTAIAANAFAGTTLTKVNMKSETPPTLGEKVFEGSSAMIYVPATAVDAYKAAENWSSYTSIIFADGVVVEWVIEEGTLISYNGTATEVVIPETVTKISATAFANTGAQITKLTIGKNVSEVEATWFQYFTAIDEFVLNSEHAIIGGKFDDGRIIFDGASTAKKTFKLSFGNNVTEVPSYIGMNAKSYITALDFGTAPITKIGIGAFAKCSKISTVPTLPSTLQELGEQVFSSCTGLVGEITIPSGVTVIPKQAFSSCTKITKVTLQGNVTQIGDGAFNGCKLLAEINFPETLTSIGNNAFASAAFVELVIPASVTLVDFNAFSGCIALTKVTWNATASTTPSMYAFNGNTALTTFIIGENVTSLPECLFQKLTAMTSLTVKAVTPPTALSAFTGFTPNSALKIYVPAASVDAYKAATNWSKYADMIEAIPAEEQPETASIIPEALPVDNKE